MNAIADTSYGRFRGAAWRGGLAFRGIPYAVPPLGADRFARPVPCPPVASAAAPTDAFAAGPAPMQARGNVLATRPVAACSENCLYLDVYTPALHGRRPVLVWIHGGGYIHGSGGDPLTDGGRLCHSQDVVVVTFNYRLGIFGAAAFATAGHSPGRGRRDDEGGVDLSNAGLADQIAVLRWVAAEIAAFGGDPHNVTLIGESSGGMSVATLLTSPAARGLVQRAVVMSGNATSVQPLSGALRTTAAVATAAGCAPGAGNAPGAAAMRALSADALLAAQASAAQRAAAEGTPLSFRPAIDGDLVPCRPLNALRAGVAAEVPLLIGSTRDEQRLYYTPRRRFDADDLRARIRHRLGYHGVDPVPATIDHIVDHYRHATAEATPLALWCAIETDLAFRLPALDIVRARTAAGAVTNTFLYRFDWPSPALHGWLGACHALDVPFVFGNFDAPGIARFVGATDAGAAAAQGLSEHIMGTIASFARSGGSGLGPWLPATAARPTACVFDAGPPRYLDVDSQMLALWDSVLPARAV